MSTVKVGAEFDGSKVESGLQRMKGQAQKIGADIDKGFSFGSIAKNFIGGFIGINLATKIVEPFKQAADYAAKMADAADRLRGVTLSGILGRNSPERGLQFQSQEQKDVQRRLEAIGQKLSSLPDFSDPNWIKLVAQNPSLANPFVATAKKGEYDSLITERNMLQEQLQSLGDAIENTTRGLEITNRRIDADRSGIMDQRRVRRGQMSGVEAAEAAALRAANEFNETLRMRGAGTESKTAYNALLQAQDAAEIARTAFEKDRVQGIAPQISSSSLAQLGGGGNVNVFGGRTPEGLTELRSMAASLRSIDVKIGRGTDGDISVNSSTTGN